MKAHLLLFFKFYESFGWFNGIRLFFQFKTRLIRKLKIPGLAHPLFLRPGTSDVHAFNQVFLEHQYDFPLPFEPAIIIDAGSNIGLFAIKMKNRYPNAKVICIEPDPENFRILEKNVSPYKGITCEKCGLWNKDSMATLSDQNQLGKWGMVVGEDRLEGAIPLYTINTFLEKRSLYYADILKLDVETSEKQLFSEKYEDWLPRIRAIIIKLHAWNPRVFVQIINLTGFPGMRREINNFRNFWKNRDVEVYVADMLTWGIFPGQPIKISRYPCPTLWRDMNVHADGTVSACCIDWDKSLVIGNALDNSLEQIWSGEKLRNLRNIHYGKLESTLTLCRECNYWSTIDKL